MIRAVQVDVFSLFWKWGKVHVLPPFGPILTFLVIYVGSSWGVYIVVELDNIIPVEDDIRQKKHFVLDSSRPC